MDRAKSAREVSDPGDPVVRNGGESGACITFAQLSDPHLSSPQGAGVRELMNKRVLGYLSWWRNRRLEHRREVLDALLRDMSGLGPDHVVVTGDLTHVGLPRECRQANRWLASVGTPGDVTVIPGNHDTYVHSKWSETLGLWTPYMVSDDQDSNALRQPADLFPSLRVRGPVAFIGLSSARPSAPFLAVGSLGARQRRRLAEVLDRCGRRGLFRVVLVHHSPLPASDKWRKRLTDSGALCQVLRRHGAELVLHGHTHRGMEAELTTASGTVPVIGLASASAVGRGHKESATYHLCRVERNNGTGWDLSVSSRTYVPGKGGFEAAGERTWFVPASPP